MIRYCELFGYGGKNALTNVSNDLTQVVYLQKMDHNSQQPSHMPLGGPALSCPLMPLTDQYFCTHCKSYKLCTNTKIIINNEIRQSQS
jgi:hypothetical protein